ncbi:hypothetical protein HDE_11182 [Halotydeus destructor]|nr:hypothetical protein HDE_11182 [Halotydeus destructor]
MLISGLCCSSQLFDVLNEYFHYETVTRVALKRPFTTRPPSLVVCLTLRSLVPSYKAGNLTVKQMADSTPKMEGLIDYCRIREANGFRLSFSNSSQECEQMFDLRKYIKQNYVCYSFDLNGSILDFKVYHITNSLRFPKFYMIQLKSNFKGADYYFMHISDHKLRDHGRSDSFTEQFRALNESGYGGHNYVSLTYKSFRSGKLPPPYDTNCRDYSKDPKFQSSSDCFDHCVRKLIVEALDVLPFSIAIYDEPEIQIISERQLDNETLRKTLDGAESFCTRKCPSANCMSTDYTPVIMSSAGQQKPALDLYITNEPETTVDFLPKQLMVDVTVYILSCIGFWFGFSPFLAMMDIEKLIRPRCTKTALPLRRGRNIELKWKKVADVKFDLHAARYLHQPIKTFMYMIDVKKKRWV